MSPSGHRTGLIVIAALVIASFSACQYERIVADSPVAEKTERKVTVTAGLDPDTRTYLGLQEGNSPAKVFWQNEDAFKMFCMSGSSSYRTAVFTTTEEGVTKADFTSSYSVSGGPCYSLYPSSSVNYFQKMDGEYVMVMPVPSVQTVVEGGVESGLLKSAAYSASVDDDHVFKNLLSLVRFRLAGDIVSEIQSIEFDAGVTVAGDATVHFTDGEPSADFAYGWVNPTVERSTKITLNGSFKEGVDYFIAMVPAEISGFNMVFKGSNGQLTKHSSKSLDLTKSQIANFGTITLGNEYDNPQEYAVIKYMSQTKGNKPVDICVVPEGFRASELDKFESLAAEGIDFLFAAEPYKTYKDYFNVYFLNVPSHESGASITDGNGTITTAKDTYFGVRWGEDSYSDMECNDDAVYSFVASRCPEVVDGTLSVVDVPVLMIINDTRYGGRCLTISDGRGIAMVPYTDSGGTLRWSISSRVASQDTPVASGSNYNNYVRQFTSDEMNEIGTNTGTWKNTLVHEFGGHCFARFKDEYWGTSYYTSQSSISSHSWSVPFGLNVSGYYDSVPWADELLSNLSSLTAMDSNYGRIGRYQGGDVSLFNRWRSEIISCMIDNRTYFSTWQRMLIVKKIMEKAGLEYSSDEFFANDVTIDPVRDQTSSSIIGLDSDRMVRDVPLLPPPILKD